MKTLDKNLGDIVKKRKKAQAELEASRSVFSSNISVEQLLPH
jgi:hypothetical protein